MSQLNLDQIIEDNIQNYDSSILDFALLILGKMYILNKEKRLSSECHLILHNKNNIQIMVDLLDDVLNSGLCVNDAMINFLSTVNSTKEDPRKFLMSEERIKQVSTRNCLEIHNHLIHLEKNIESLEYELSEKFELLNRNMEELHQETKISIRDTILKTISMLVPTIIDDSLKLFFKR